ncbi:MAG TPA: hypothetical protein VFI17_09685 [Solirubrobacterales bacterium]|nr:hypothetical protein [Solirubrobacterales bacterium]
MRAWRLVLLGLGVLALLAPAARAADPAGKAAAEKLAARYAPITMLREQTDPPCDTAEEQYQPTSVDTVLGNTSVTLSREDAEGKLEQVGRAPTAAGIAGLGPGYYLDLYGTVLGDTCVYAKDFKRFLEAGTAPAVTYAHIAREPDHAGFTLQYWFFWYFNQFNDLHEADWEGMQLSFEAETPAAALSEEPREIILFQHAGGERAEWEDAKVQKEGTHAVVYPAAGSHATFYDSAVYVENGQNGSGVGCDNTSEPLRELRPRPVLLPNHAPDEGRFQWLSYLGRWGEREKGFNNGPQGPVTKTVWREPFAWMADQRSTSPRLPGGSVVGPQVTSVFCGAVATASDLINLDTRSHWAAAATIGILLVLLFLFVGLTRWGPVDLEELRARRSFGQLVRTARQLYGRHWTALTAIGLTAFPIVGGANYLAGLLATDRNISDAAGRAGVNLAFGDLVETVGRPLAMAIVAGTVVAFARLLVEARRPGFRTAWRAIGARFWRVVGVQLLVMLSLFLLALTIIGLPFAIYKFVAWIFVKEEVLFEDRSLRGAMHGSSALVRGRWWHTVRVAAFLAAVGIVTGPALTLALVFTSLPLIWINLIGSFIYALLIPYVALGETLLYFDLQARAEAEPARPRRRLLRSLRPARLGP